MQAFTAPSLAALLADDEPPPFEAVVPQRPSPYFITCDHAGRRIPRSLGTLGLGGNDLKRHIAWDIGAAGVARNLATMLDAFLILQTYSRLVIDCNRPLSSPTLIARSSEDTEIPGNLQVSSEEALVRQREIFDPYHERIRRELDLRASRREPTILILMHSFTPRFRGVDRPWHAGVLYHRDARLGRAMLELLRAEPGLLVGDNEPYSVDDQSDYAVIQHGEQRQLPHVELEIRQDLIEDERGQWQWATRLARLLPQACAPLFSAPVL